MNKIINKRFISKMILFFGIFITSASPILIIMLLLKLKWIGNNNMFDIFRQMIMAGFSISFGFLIASIFDRWIIGFKEKKKELLVAYSGLMLIYISLFIISFYPAFSANTTVGWQDIGESFLGILIISILSGLLFPYQETNGSISYENFPEILKNEFEQKNKKIEKYETLLNSIQNIINKQQNEIQEKSDH